MHSRITAGCNTYTHVARTNLRAKPDNFTTLHPPHRHTNTFVGKFDYYAGGAPIRSPIVCMWRYIWVILVYTTSEATRWRAALFGRTCGWSSRAAFVLRCIKVRLQIIMLLDGYRQIYGSGRKIRAKLYHRGRGIDLVYNIAAELNLECVQIVTKERWIISFNMYC